MSYVGDTINPFFRISFMFQIRLQVQHRTYKRLYTVRFGKEKKRKKWNKKICTYHRYPSPKDLLHMYDLCMIMMLIIERTRSKINLPGKQNLHIYDTYYLPMICRHGFNRRNPALYLSHAHKE